MRKTFILTLIPLFLLLACSGEKNRNGNEQEEKRNSITRKASMKKGKVIAQAAFKALSGKLKEKVKGEGIEGALDLCSVHALAFTDSVGRAHDVSIQRVTDQPRNPVSGLSEADRKVFSRFSNKWDGPNKPAPKLVKEQEKELFYAPISIKKGICLKCHGKKGKDIDPAHFSKIRELYPNGKATGYEMGDLRGMWKIGIPN